MIAMAWKRVLKDGPFGDDFEHALSENIIQVLKDLTKKIPQNFGGNFSEDSLTKAAQKKKLNYPLIARLVQEELKALDEPMLSSDFVERVENRYKQEIVPKGVLGKNRLVGPISTMVTKYGKRTKRKTQHFYNGVKYIKERTYYSR